MSVLTPTDHRVSLTVLGIANDNARLLGDLTISLPLARTAFGQREDALDFVSYAPGADNAQVQPAVNRLLASYFPQARSRTAAQFKQDQANQINTLLALIYVLLALSVIVSLFGIVNTLILSIYERTRELGMMRAIGTSRRQVRQMIRYESVITALIGGVFGLVIGVVGAILVTTLRAVGLGLRAGVPGGHAADPAARGRPGGRARRAASRPPGGAPGHAGGARRRVAPARGGRGRRGRTAKLPGDGRAPSETTDPELEQTVWDLEPLVEGEGPDGVERRLGEALERAKAFAASYAGKLGELDVEGLRDGDGRAGRDPRAGRPRRHYAALRFSADTADPANGALLQKAQEHETAIETTLLFFELEWAALSQERAEELLAGDGLDFCRHHLRNVRRYRDHLLSEPEEKILAEKALTGSGAWARLFEELTSAIEVELSTEGSEKVALDVALSRLALPDREARRATAEAVTAALAPGLRTRAFLFNTLLADKATDDRLRRYPHWLAARNLANEASDESVQALIEAVRGRYEIPRRWYRLKAKLLGVERLADYDRMAAVSEDEVTFPFAPGPRDRARLLLVLLRGAR